MPVHSITPAICFRVLRKVVASATPCFHFYLFPFNVASRKCIRAPKSGRTNMTARFYGWSKGERGLGTNKSVYLRDMYV